MKLYIVRHGETQENADGIVQGWMDTSLNAVGREQARVAARDFRHQVDAIFHSDLLRCVQTAEEFKKCMPHITAKADHRLRERHLGEAQGARRDKHDWEVFRAARGKVTIAGAEEFEAYKSRVDEFLEFLRSSHPPDSKILIITHGGTINIILEITKTRDEHYSVKNCEVLEVDL